MFGSRSVNNSDNSWLGLGKTISKKIFSLYSERIVLGSNL